MSNHSSLVFVVLLIGLGAASAQLATPPQLVTSRSVATQQAPGGPADTSPTVRSREDWAAQVMSKFLDDGTPETKPAD